MALGVNDIAGGAAKFRAAYGAITQHWGPWSVTLGVGKGRDMPPGTRQPLDGVFGGVDYRLPAGLLPGSLTLSAEHDAHQALAGGSWTSPALPALAGARFSVTAHRTFERGAMPGHTALGFFLTLPFGEHVAEAGRTEAAPSGTAPAPAAAPSPAAESEPARLGQLQAALVALGLERVRVGRVERRWVVEYQNHRYGRHELDAAGLVLGLAAQEALAEVERIVLSALKTGQPVMTLGVSAQAWRDFVRDGGAGGALQASLQVQRGQGRLMRSTASTTPPCPSSRPGWTASSTRPRCRRCSRSTERTRHRAALRRW